MENRGSPRHFSAAILSERLSKLPLNLRARERTNPGFLQRSGSSNLTGPLMGPICAFGVPIGPLLSPAFGASAGRGYSRRSGVPIDAYSHGYGWDRAGHGVAPLLLVLVGDRAKPERRVVNPLWRIELAMITAHSSYFGRPIPLRQQ
jgi:hypothetical protein